MSVMQPEWIQRCDKVAKINLYNPKGLILIGDLFTQFYKCDYTIKITCSVSKVTLEGNDVKLVEGTPAPPVILLEKGQFFKMF